MAVNLLIANVPYAYLSSCVNFHLGNQISNRIQLHFQNLKLLFVITFTNHHMWTCGLSQVRRSYLSIFMDRISILVFLMLPIKLFNFICWNGNDLFLIFYLRTCFSFFSFNNNIIIMITITITITIKNNTGIYRAPFPRVSKCLLQDIQNKVEYKIYYNIMT